jgi:hypothetical protein
MATKKTVKVPGKLAWRFEPPAKVVHYRDTDAKYVGDEPQYPDLELQRSWTPAEYQSKLMRTLNWYAHTQDKKKSAEWLAVFLERNPRRAKLAAAVRRGDVWPGSTIGFALRAGRVGLELRFNTLRTILRHIKEAENAVNQDSGLAPQSEVKEEKKQTFNIQERLAEKTAECAGEIEGRFDDFITSHEFKGEPKTIELLSQFNVQPAHIKTIIALAERRIREYEEVVSSKDSQVLEAYKHYGKRQLTAVVKWWQQVLADCNSYGIIKKASKAPRKKKAISPEKMVSKLKFMKEFAELKLKSIEATQILTAQELWVYNTKTRKLGIYVADQYAGALGVKNSAIVGFDSAASMQKTLRKPKDQLKEFSATGKPAAKKWFKTVKSVETKLNGRINSETILLKVYK